MSAYNPTKKDIELCNRLLIPKINYKEKLLQIMDMFLSMEGTVYELEDWKIYGIKDDEKKVILEEFNKAEQLRTYLDKK
jgi:hypothetical protein